MGKPIVVTKVANPTGAELDALHKKYMDEVHALYDNFKEKFHSDRKRDLRFV